MAKKITQTQAAQLLGLSQPLLNQYMRKFGSPPYYLGKLPGVRGRHEGYYLEHEVLRWDRKRKREREKHDKANAALKKAIAKQSA
jgi:predicted transcriptional regulator